MSKKPEVKLGSFSNEGISSGFSEINNEDFIRVFRKIQDKLKQSFSNEIKRVEFFLKKNYGVLPREQDFFEWFEENKIYKNWVGLPSVSDEELNECTKFYLEKWKVLIGKRENKSEVEPFALVLENSRFNSAKLELLLAEEIFKPSTNIESIKGVFAYPLVRPNSKLKLNINNKQFVFLLNLLVNEGILDSRNLFEKIGSLKCFIKKSGKLLENRKTLDQANHQLKKTPFAIEAEDNLRELVKKIKKE